MVGCFSHTNDPGIHFWLYLMFLPLLIPLKHWGLVFILTSLLVFNERCNFVFCWSLNGRFLLFLCHFIPIISRCRTKASSHIPYSAVSFTHPFQAIPPWFVVMQFLFPYVLIQGLAHIGLMDSYSFPYFYMFLYSETLC